MAEASRATSSSFSLTEFKRIAEEQRVPAQREATKWHELNEGIVYRIRSIEKKNSRFGVCHLLHCTEEGGEGGEEGEICVFAPRALIDDFRKRYQIDHIPYFITLGQGVCELTKNKKNLFDLIFVGEWGCPEIIVED